MSNNININSMLRPSLDSEEEEEDDIGQMSDGSSSSSGGSSNRSSSSSSSSAPGSLPEDDVDVEDEDMSDQDALSESETEDDTTTCQSDELELAQLSKRDTFRLPRGLCENSTIFHEFFSMETWQLLPQHVQARLQCLLPDFTGLVSAPQAGAEQQRTLVQLFNGGLQRFGQSPLLQLQRQLEDGNLRPDVLKLRRSIQHSSRREFRFQQAERLSQLAKELFLSREHMLKLAYTSSPPEEATASASVSKSMMPRPRKRKPPALSMENKLCSQRAKKRYVQELLEVIQELKVSPGEISAEEEDEECVDLMQRLPKMEAELKLEPTSVRSSNAADKKSIYNTFFKRRSGVDDEQVLRTMQAVRIQQLNDKNFKKYLRDYKRRKMEQPESPEFDTSEVRLRDICTRAQFVGSFKPGRKPKALLARLNPDPPALVPIGGIKNEPEDDIFVKEEPQQHQKQHRLQDYVPKEQMPKKMQPAAAAAPVPALIPKLEPISVPSATISNLTTISPTNPALKAAAVHIVGSPPNRGEVVRPAASPRPACYFSLLRDLFVSTPQHRLTYGELQLLLASWREKHSDAAIPTGDVTRIQQPDWSQLLQSAVNFLAADFGPLPAEYVPYIEHKTVLNIYQWIGAGRDSDARLCTLCQYWLRTQKEEQPIATTVHLNPCPGAMFIATTPVDALATQTLTPTPPPRCPTSWTVRTASQADMLEFQRQERLRFEYPHRPFTYRLNGYESVVGPVKGIYTQSLPLNKARGHAVMVDDRPPFVTILTLVRDATARLPNGEGTRSEISELLKCSQYVNHQAAENVLQTIVSGALDRMHGGIDPCVKYDAKRKIWIYLHRNRSEEEFERMHKHNLSLVKQKQQQRKQLAKPKKEDGDSSTELQDMPALVPSVGNPTPTAAPVSVSTAAGTLLHVKKTSPLPVKCPPVPPLKYNIPPANSNNNNNSTSSSQGTGMALSPTGANASPNSMQKSLLKPVPMGAVHRPMAGGTPVKTGNFAISKISPQRNTTPILVSTPSGMQTVHVATTPTSTQLGTSPTMSVNKKLTIKKPPTTSKIGNFIIPLDQQQQQQQQHSPQQHSQVLGKPKSMTISPRPQLSKNIIRLLPAGAAATGQVKSPQVQILGPRVVPQSTVRPVQQKIGAVSIISNKSVEASTSPITIATSSSSAVSAVSVGGGAGGTIVKMSPQAFATLQQQQLKQKAMGGTAKIASPVQTSPQQRILVGNTAISSNKKIVFQAMAKTTPKILTTTASSGGTTVRSPQQRIVLQNFKQAAAAGGGGATTVVSSTNATRMIRTSTTVSTAAGGAVNASQGGHIITLDSLLQKQHQQQHSGGKLLTTGSNIIQLATSSAGNVITLTPNQSQNTQPIQVQAKHLPTMARIVSATASGGGPTMVPKIIGKTTVLPGKPLLLHAKAIKQLGGGSVVTTQPTATTTTAGTNAVRTTQSIVIGGQTVKIQGAIPARSGGAPMQTVIMGNQLVRLAPSTSGSSSTNSNHLTTVASSGIATAPKTLLIGAGGTQTLRLAKNVLLTNKQGTSNSTGSSNATGTVTGGATAGNNLVFAVQGNGGQLFFSQGLQGMNLKPLSNMKVIPMVSAAGAAATAGGKITVTTTAKAEAKKLMPGTVLKTAPSGSGN